MGDGEAETRSGVKGVEDCPARSQSCRGARRRGASSPGMCGGTGGRGAGCSGGPDPAART